MQGPAVEDPCDAVREVRARCDAAISQLARLLVFDDRMEMSGNSKTLGIAAQKLCML